MKSFVNNWSKYIAEIKPGHLKEPLVRDESCADLKYRVGEGSDRKLTAVRAKKTLFKISNPDFTYVLRK